MVAEDAVEFGAEAFDAAAALLVEEVGAEFYGDAIYGFEGVLQQEQFALGVQRRALDRLAVPGRADFQAAVCRVYVHVSSHADGLARGLQNREWEHRASSLKG